ncbi:MAG: hypothetical protein GY822_30820 [Deltaproteobacteria bacterium]|nr:hypothetical protein [Deltaproteobacteria bacterium]
MSASLGCAGEDPGPDAAPSPSDAGVSGNDDAGVNEDAGAPAATLETASILALTELNESDIGFRWIGAGQPSEGRVHVVVTEGARVISYARVHDQ